MTIGQALRSTTAPADAKSIPRVLILPTHVDSLSIKREDCSSSTAAAIEFWHSIGMGQCYGTPDQFRT